MRILIAEDDAVSRHLLRSYLEKWGHKVTESRDGAEGWEKFAAEPFPMVVADWMMPGMDGLELIQKIRAREALDYCYIILLTAKSQKEDIVRGMETGADDFVTKPFDREELRVRISAGERILRLEQGLREQNRLLREAQSALVQSEKFSSVGQMALGMAQEIDAPLNSMSESLYVLRRDVLAAMQVLEIYREGREALSRCAPEVLAAADREEQHMDLPNVQASLHPLFNETVEGLNRLGEVLRDLSDFARADDFAMKEMSLSSAIRDCISMTRGAAESRGVRLEDSTPDLPPIVGNPGKIKKVLFNLLTNALEAVKDGGSVTVRAVPDAGGQGITVEIEDDGTGIDPALRKQIFDPFFSTKQRAPGLGLSVASSIAHAHGGRIDVQSEPGRGSVFRILLPLKQAAKAE